MRRALTLVIPALILTACGSSDSSSSTTGSANTESSAGSTVPSTDSTTPESTTGSSADVGTTAPVDATAPTSPPLSSVALPADCPIRPPATTVPPLPDPVEKPEIELPDPIPTELQSNDLTEGSGREAADGDQISVYYVGVLSKDGTEFDSNFGSGEPFTIALGTGQVIPGWDQGLVGVQAGTRRQLDIPAELAYGDQGSGAIGPNEALTFIVDVVAVDSPPPAPPAADPADAPTFDFPTVEAGAEFATEDIVPGDKCEVAQPGDTVYINAITVRGDTGDVLDDSWKGGQTYQVLLDSDTVYGFAQGVVGMGVGGQRLVTIPPADGFGAEGNVQQGLEADTVLLVLLELEGIVGVTEMPTPDTTADTTPAEGSTTAESDGTASTAPATESSIAASTTAP